MASRAKKRRIDLELSQEQVAAATGLKQTDISKLERGKIAKTTGILRLAQALKCNPYWLEFGEGDQDASISTSAAPAGYSVEALGLAWLLDQVSSRIGRNRALSAATDAILRVIDESVAAPTHKQAQHSSQEKPPA